MKLKTYLCLLVFSLVILSANIFLVQGKSNLPLVAKAAGKKEESSNSKKKMKLNYSQKKLKVAQSFNLKVQNLPDSYSISWEVEDSNIVSVADSGKVVAMAPGKTTITIIVNDNTVLTCKISVISNKKKLKRSPEEQKIFEKLKSLKKKFKEKQPWGDDKEYFCQKNNTLGSGCAALGFQISDELFGKDAPMKEKQDLSNIKNKIRIGDLLRILDDTHTVIVVDKEEDGVILLEGNFYFGNSKEGKIHWGEKLKFEEIEKNANYYVTRYED